MKNVNNRLIIILILFSFTLIPCIHFRNAYAEQIRELRIAGQWPFHPTKAVAVDPERNLLFLGDGERLCMLDDQLNTIALLAVSKAADIGGIFYSKTERRVYVASRSDGLWIIDVSDEQNPAVIGGYLPVLVDDYGNEIETEVNGVFIDNGIAWLASGINGVQIVNVSEVANPDKIASINLHGAYGVWSYAVDAYISGEYLYVADLVNGVHIYKISDPNQPVLKKIIALPNVRDIVVSENYLYTALEGNGLEIINIENPEDPKEGSLYKTDGRERSVVIDGNTAYVGYNTMGVHMLDISDRKNPLHDSTWEYTRTGAKSMALDQLDKALYITDDEVGLQKIDISNPDAMTRLQAFDTPADATAIALSSDYAYVLDNTVGNDPGKEGLRILSITEVLDTAMQFRLSGFVATPGNASDIFISDEYAYVVDGTAGLQIIDVSDKTNPTISGSVDTPGEASGIFKNGKYAYVADGNQGLAVIDIGIPEFPNIVKQVPTNGDSRDVVVSGKYAYVADGTNGLTRFDITVPGDPQRIDSWETPGTAVGITLSGNYAYVADGERGIVIFNLENPDTPPEITGTFDTTGYAAKVTVSGIYAYVADGANGVTTLDISDPSLPVRIDEWSYNTTGITTDIFAVFSKNETLFILAADGPAGLVVLNPTFEKTNENQSGSSGAGCFINIL